MANSVDLDETPRSAASHLGLRSLFRLSVRIHTVNTVHTKLKLNLFVRKFLFVLRFYGPVNPMGSCRARSVYLTTRLLGRLSPLSG